MLFKGRLLAEILFVFLLTILILVLAAYSLGNSFNYIIPPLVVLSLAFLLIIAVSGAIKNKKALKHIMCVLGAMIAATGWLTLFYNINEKPILEYPDIYNGTEATIKAKINKVTHYSYYTQFDLKVIEIDGEKVSRSFKLDLCIYDTVNAQIDDIIETQVIFSGIGAGESAYSKSNGYYIAAEHFDPNDAIEDDDIGNEDSDSDNDGQDYQILELSYPITHTSQSYLNLPKPSYVITAAESHGLSYYLDRMQQYTRDVFAQNIKWDENIRPIDINLNDNILTINDITQEAALVYGVFAGKTNFIESRIRTNFNRTGISHTIAVSGLHLSILTGIIFSFLRIIKTNKKIICALVILCCLFFMAFTGFSASVVRSGIMTVLFYLAFLLSRKSDSITSLFVAGTVICLITPYNILNIGFQLSFLATLGIILTTKINAKIVSKIPKISLTDNKKPSAKFRRTKSKIRTLSRTIVSSLLVTLAATIFTLPVTSYSFKTLSLISPMVNLIVSPFVTLISMFALLLVAFSFLPAISFIFGVPLYFFAKIILNTASLGASFKYACISVSSTKHDIFSFVSLIFLALIILFFVAYSKNKIVNTILSVLIAVCVVIMGANLIYVRHIFKDSLRTAYYSDYKNQSIILFQDDYDKADIIDITHGTQAPVFTIRDMILDNGATGIGSIILTHYHKHHVKMLEKLMNYFTIDMVFVPSPKTDYDNEVFEALFNSSVSVSQKSPYKKNYDLFMYYDGIMDLGDTAVMVNEFEYEKMRHMTVDIWRGDNKFLYLGIGYGEIYSYVTNTYDVVFYGTHKHNRQDNDYSAGIFGTRYGVLSDYIDNFGNRASTRLTDAALHAYDFDSGGAELIHSNEADVYPVFEITSDGEVFYYSRKK